MHKEPHSHIGIHIEFAYVLIYVIYLLCGSKCMQGTTIGT